MKLALALFLAAAAALGDARATLARWREALELDLAAEVLREAPQATEAGGECAQSGEARALWARALAGAGRAREALEVLRPGTLAEAERPWLEIARARLAIEADDLAGARAILVAAESKSELGARFPERPEAWLLLGRALWRGEQAAQARVALERFVAAAPLDCEAPDAWHMLALQARRSGEAARAAQCAEAERKSAEWQAFYRTRRLQIREHPREPLPRLGLAELWIAAGDDVRAKEVLDELLRLAPDFARAELALARLEKRAGHADAAAAHLRRYRELGGTEEP